MSDSDNVTAVPVSQTLEESHSKDTTRKGDSDASYIHAQIQQSDSDKKEIGYKWPTNDREIARLNLQHEMWKYMLYDTAGLFPIEVREIVDEVMLPAVGESISSVNDQEPEKKRVLDVGYGAANWVLLMASRYPNAEVVGIDFNGWVPPNAPPNTRFIKGDANLVLKEYLVYFDVINARTVVTHAKDGLELIANMRDSLKPGGVILLADATWKPVNERRETIYSADVSELHSIDKSSIPTQKGAYFALWMSLLKISGVDVSHSRISGRELAWALEGDGKRSFENVTEKELWCPWNWDGVSIPKGGEECGFNIKFGKEMMKVCETNFLGGVQMMKGVVKTSTPSRFASRVGLTDEEIEEVCRRATEDFYDSETKLTNAWIFAWARKAKN